MKQSSSATQKRAGAFAGCVVRSVLREHHIIKSIPVQALEAGHGAIHVPRWALHRQLPSGRFLGNCEGRDVFPEQVQ